MAVPLLSSVSHTTSTLFCHRSVVHTRRPLSSLFFQLPHNINPVCSILTHSSITYSSNLSPLAAIPFDLSPPPIDHDLYVVDLSHYGRIRVSGEDRIKFLHNQSTANFEALSEGGGCDTVLVTPTARTIDIAQAWIMKTAVTLVVSPATSKASVKCSISTYFLVTT